MQKKLLAVAVAGALVAPAAFAQSSVTISGALNLWYESAAAGGATNTGGDAKSRDRIVDGAGSNIRFTVVEDLGGGMQAFGQVESGVLANADTRANASNNGGAAGGWANRNSGVGLRSNAWGEILLGIWDIHYQEEYAIDPQIIKGASNTNLNGIVGTFGTYGNTNIGSGFNIGTRYSNVIRYQSPSWGGFNFRIAYARPSDGLPLNSNGVSYGDDKKNRVWNFAPNYSAGPIFVGASFLRDKDISSAPITFFGASAGANAAGMTPAAGNVGVVAAGGSVSTAAGNNLWDITSDRFMASYTFPMGFRLGFMYDRSKLKGSTATTGTEIRRTAWAVPIGWSSGAHTLNASYGKAKSWEGNINGVDVGTINITPAGGAAQTVGGNTGARFLMLGYQYDLSKRTNIHLSYVTIRNDSLAGYDYFSTGVGMAAGNYGADPRVYSIGLRHAF